MYIVYAPQKSSLFPTQMPSADLSGFFSEIVGIAAAGI